VARKPLPPAQAAPAMRYVGDGAFVLGVPMRDLSAAEWLALSDNERQAAQALYEPDVPALPDVPAEE